MKGEELMVITDMQVDAISKKVLLNKGKVKQIIQNCNTLGDIFNLDLGARDKTLESKIKDTIFKEMLKLRKGK